MISGPDIHPKVLIFTFCEYGQANVNLSLAYELAIRDVEIHIASFAPLEKRVLELREIVSKKRALTNGDATGSNSNNPPLVDFHLCKGPTHFEALKEAAGIEEHNLPHAPGISGALESYSFVDTVVAPMPGDVYVESIENCKEIMRDVKQNVVVVDSMFRSAVDSCVLAKQKFIIMSPNSYKEVAMDAQPWLGMLKYPALSSGFPFPLPLSYIPSNLYLHIRIIFTLATSRRIRSLQSSRTSAGLKNHFFVPRIPSISCLCPSLPEIDFPFTVPPDIISCGPIVFPASLDEVQEKDPEMFAWLGRGKTVLVNLGSHAMADEGLAREFAGGLRVLLDSDETKEVQILWKVKAHGSIGEVLDEILGKEVEEGRVKIVDWLLAEPVAILQHPNVVCTVHHGGANSFYEGVWSGVPHIVIPLWYDTYDFARRAEYLKIGVYGSEKSAPRVTAEEFGKALVRVVGAGATSSSSSSSEGSESKMFRENVKRLQGICRERGNGREVACRKVLELIGLQN